jgi:hypothetical protein
MAIITGWLPPSQFDTQSTKLRKKKKKLVKIPPEIAAPFGFCVAVYTFDITYK